MSDNPFHIADLVSEPDDMEVLKKQPPRVYNVHRESHASYSEESKASPIISSSKHNGREDLAISMKYKQMEASMKTEMDDMKLDYIRQCELREEKLKQEITDLSKTQQKMIDEKETHWQILILERDRRIRQLEEQLQFHEKEWKQKSHDKSEQYIAQMNAMEQQHHANLHAQETRWREKVQVIQDQINTSEEHRRLTEKAKLEAKEVALQRAFDKKIKRYTKQIETVVEHYNAKELVVQGALEEARREIIHLQAVHSAQEQCNKEELVLKDKRLVEIQQYLDEVDEISRDKQEWRTTAHELASIVIIACGTVEELPAELWSNTTPGLFTSVWDDLRQKKSGYGMAAVDDHVRSYTEKKRECVIASRAALAKCLRYSKVRLLTFLYSQQRH